MSVTGVYCFALQNLLILGTFSLLSRLKDNIRPRLDTSASLWATLARCGRSSHIQAWGDGVQVLGWPGTGLSVWAVYTGRSSYWTTASSFRQPPSTRCSTVSARYVRPSHLCCRWTDMELVSKQFTWAGHANWLFSSYRYTEDVSFWSVLGTLSALEARFVTMRYINWHFTFRPTYAIVADVSPSSVCPLSVLSSYLDN